MEDVYALWTRTPDTQPTADRYDNAAPLSHALQAVERLPTRDRATAKVAFSIVQPGTQVPSYAPGAASLLTSNTRTAYLTARCTRRSIRRLAAGPAHGACAGVY